MDIVMVVGMLLVVPIAVPSSANGVAAGHPVLAHKLRVIFPCAAAGSSTKIRISCRIELLRVRHSCKALVGIFITWKRRT